MNADAVQDALGRAGAALLNWGVSVVRHMAPAWLLALLDTPEGTLVAEIAGLVLVGLVVWLVLTIEPGGSRSRGPRAVRWANAQDLAGLLWRKPHPTGLLVGQEARAWLAIPPNARGETGNLLVVGPPRSGKGLLATSQLLAWEGSAFVSDPKGELFTATAGWRQTLGPVYVVNPRGLGHRLDPVGIRHGPGALRQAATILMGDGSGEGHGAAFSQRAAYMLLLLFEAARLEQLPALPYVAWCLDHGMDATADRLASLRPEWRERLVGRGTEPRGFLQDSWESIRGRLGGVLDPDVVPIFGGSDFHPADLYRRRATVYVVIPERDLEGFEGLVRLLWETFLGECLEWRDAHPIDTVQPILALVDEAGVAPIPVLPRRANTVNGRGISLWVAVQSLAQLEGSYGRAAADALREGMRTHVFFRPADLVTASHLEQRVGRTLVASHTRSRTRQPSATSSSLTYGEGEREVPLLLAQDALQLADQLVIGFTAGRPPMRIHRGDWRTDRLLEERQGLPVPELRPVAPLPDLEPPTAEKPKAPAPPQDKPERVLLRSLD